MSIHAANAAIAARTHAEYFGDSGAAMYRETDRCKWATVLDAIIHHEKIGYETRGTGATVQRVRVLRREIYVPGVAGAFKCHGQIRIGACGTVYTIISVAERSGRVQLTLQGAAVREITRPNYRPE